MLKIDSFFEDTPNGRAFRFLVGELAAEWNRVEASIFMLQFLLTGNWHEISLQLDDPQGETLKDVKIVLKRLNRKLANVGVTPSADEFYTLKSSRNKLVHSYLCPDDTRNDGLWVMDKLEYLRFRAAESQLKIDPDNAEHSDELHDRRASLSKKSTFWTTREVEKVASEVKSMWRELEHLAKLVVVKRRIGGQ